MIDWDGEGRMWVVEMPGYMPDINAKGEHEPIGKIVVLEDTNRDGRMDKRTVFQDGLVLARWLKVLARGVLVAEPPESLAVPGHQRRPSRRSQGTRHQLVRSARRERRAQRQQPAVGARQQHLHVGDRHRPAAEERQVRSAQDAVARAMGHHAGRCGTDFQEHERVGAARRCGSGALLHAPPEPSSHARQLRVAQRPERRAERGVADSSDPRRQPRLSIRNSASRWHAREVHLGVHADGVSRRSVAGRALRQHLPGRSDRQSGQPNHSWRQSQRTDCDARRIAMCAASSSPRPTSGSVRSICRSLRTARSMSSTCIAASSSTRDT